MERWRGRVAIVTGTSSGIGEAIAINLAENGMKVVGIARRLDLIQELQKSIKGEFYPLKCDITKEENIINVVKWTRENLGGADVLVNNAGVGPPCPLNDFETDNVKQLYDTNVIGLSIFTREVLKDMKDRNIDIGHIFNINSVVGHFILDFSGHYHYTATKYAITVLTEGLRRELRDSGSKIRVTSISPGMVNTAAHEPSKNSPEETDVALLERKDISDALIYALSTPPHVQVHEIIIRPIGEKF